MGVSRPLEFPCNWQLPAPSSLAAFPDSASRSPSPWSAHGGKVVLFDINDDKAAAAVAALGADNAMYLRTDVSDEANVPATWPRPMSSSAD